MKPTTKERMGVVERKAKTGAFSAAVLVAGLALGAGCRNDVDVPQKPKTEQGTPTVKEKVEKKVIREGEPLVKENFLLEKNGYFEMLRVDKIDAEGITIAPFFGGTTDKRTAGKVEVFMSEHDVTPLRMKYGESKTFRTGEFALVESLTVKVEKGPKPGTATVTLTYSDTETQDVAAETVRTKDGKIRVPFLMEKGAYFEFDAPEKQGVKAPENRAAAKSGCKMRTLGGKVNPIRAREGRCEVKKGDELLAVEFLFEKAGVFKYSVENIDEKGVEIIMYMEIVMSEHSSTKNLPWRVNYGETKAIGKIVGPDGKYVFGEDMLTVKAERGPRPGTAILTITYPDAKTQ